MKPEQSLIDRIRDFNRFYTNILGLLDRHFLDTPYSLIEGRVLYEISHTDRCTAKKIRETVDIDEGYLSRIIDTFIKQGLVRKTPASEDRRLHIIVLTEKGGREFSNLNNNSNKMITKMIGELTGREREELIDSMDRIRGLLIKE